MEDIIVIVGPTGVGKTKLSVELAKRLDAEIINGDSVSIYKHLNIGSAKPTKEEQEGIPHHLFDIKEVEDNYTVFQYQKDVRRLIQDINSRGKRIIIVGGTGLYIKAALYNYEFSETDLEDNEYLEYSNLDIFNRIKEYIPEYDCDIHNRKRLVRFLNKLEHSEKISNQKDELLYPIKVIGLTTDREVLYDRINRRVDKMIDDGLIREVEELKKYYSTSRILNSAIGYKEFVDYFINEKSIDDVINEIKTHSRRFAKRQYTFFNHQFPTNWFDVDFENFSNTVEEIYNNIKKETRN